MRLSSLLSTSCAVALLGAGVGACGGSTPSSGFDNGTDAGSSTTDGGPITVGRDGGFVFGSDGSPPNVLGCSADLQNVVDANGNVVMMCPATQGCAGGMCVDACTAAAASHGSVGCDFIVSTPSFQNQILAPCFAVFLANNWQKPLHITVARGGALYDVTKFGRSPQAGQPESSWPTVSAAGVPPGQVAVLFLSSDPAASNGKAPMRCPVPDAINAGTAVTGTGRGQAFEISTDTPVSAYDIHPYGGAKSFLPSAELLLPTSAWGTNYVTSLPRNGDYLNGGVADGPQWAHIIGMTDGTTVTIVPKVALPSGANVAAAPQNVATQFTLKSGEYIQWQPQWSQTSGPSMEMSGSIISSSHPVMFEGGNGYLCLKSSTNADNGSGGFGGCDSGHQTIPPISALASEYAVAPYATRRADLQDESIIYRIVGASDGTTLKYDPAVSGAPTTLSSGQFADFEATGAFIVKSQDQNHPFYVAQMMSGGSVTGGSRPGTSGMPGDELGDEEYVNVPAPAQYLQKYVFFTDPTYPTTNLVITRKARADGTFADVTVDCLGAVSGWKPLGSTKQYQTTNVDLLRGGTASGTCTNGGHNATSAGAFGMVVWGLDSYASYAYPAGGNVASINSVVIPPVPK